MILSMYQIDKTSYCLRTCACRKLAKNNIEQYILWNRQLLIRQLLYFFPSEKISSKMK